MKFEKTKRKRLTSDEIERTADKIRESYNHFIIEFMKPLSFKYSFEQRYLEARKASVYLDAFFAAEINVLNELIRRETEKKNSHNTKVQKNQALRSNEKKPGFAEKIIAQNREKIKTYPGLGLNDENVYEVDKLYGAFAFFEAEIWPPIESLFRKVALTRYSSSRIDVESKLFEYVSGVEGKYPPKLNALIGILSRTPRDYYALEREIRTAILEGAKCAAIFQKRLTEFMNTYHIVPEEKIIVEKGVHYMHNLMTDFRLHDFYR